MREQATLAGYTDAGLGILRAQKLGWTYSGAQRAILKRPAQGRREGLHGRVRGNGGCYPPLDNDASKGAPWVSKADDHQAAS